MSTRHTRSRPNSHDTNRNRRRQLSPPPSSTARRIASNAINIIRRRTKGSIPRTRRRTQRRRHLPCPRPLVRRDRACATGNRLLRRGDTGQRVSRHFMRRNTQARCHTIINRGASNRTRQTTSSMGRNSHYSTTHKPSRTTSPATKTRPSIHRACTNTMPSPRSRRATSRAYQRMPTLNRMQQIIRSISSSRRPRSGRIRDRQAAHSTQ